MKKRYLSKHSKDNKSNKVNRKIFIIILIVIVIATIGVVTVRNIGDKNKIKKNVNDTFSALKDLNVDEVNKHLDYKALVNSFDKIILEQNGDKDSNIEKKLFESIEWTIEDIQINDENTAEVIIEMTNKNYNHIIIKWAQSMLKMDENDINDKIQVEKLEEVIDEVTKTKTIIKKIKLVKVEENWTIEVNTDLRDLVFPGIDSIVTVLDQYR